MEAQSGTKKYIMGTCGAFVSESSGSRIQHPRLAPRCFSPDLVPSFAVWQFILMAHTTHRKRWSCRCFASWFRCWSYPWIA